MWVGSLQRLGSGVEGEHGVEVARGAALGRVDDRADRDRGRLDLSAGHFRFGAPVPRSGGGDLGSLRYMPEVAGRIRRRRREAERLPQVARQVDHVRGGEHADAEHRDHRDQEGRQELGSSSLHGPSIANRAAVRQLRRPESTRPPRGTPARRRSARRACGRADAAHRSRPWSPNPSAGSPVPTMRLAARQGVRRRSRRRRRARRAAGRRGGRRRRRARRASSRSRAASRSPGHRRRPRSAPPGGRTARRRSG